MPEPKHHIENYDPSLWTIYLPPFGKVRREKDEIVKRIRTEEAERRAQQAEAGEGRE